MAALKILNDKRQKDGSWLLDRIHPDVGLGAGYRRRREVKLFYLEEAQKPSKWITLTALRVLKRVEEAR